MTDLNLQKISIYIGILAVAMSAICGILSISSQIVSPFLPLWLTNREETPIISEGRSLILHIYDEDSGVPISRARVLVFLEGGRFIGETDDTGTVQFRVSDSVDAIEFDYIVEADNYNIERQNNVRYQGRKIDISLSKSEGDQADVIVLVTDEYGASISGAEVILLIEGDVFPEVTDSNGIAKFVVAFLGNNVDAQVRVDAEGFEPDYQFVALLPNKILGIRLDSSSGTFQQVEIFSTPVSNTYSQTPTITRTFTPVPTNFPTGTPTTISAPTFTSTPMPVISFAAKNGTINEGECDILIWNVENVREVYLDGEGVFGQDTRQVCPDENTTYELRVVLPNDAEEIHKVLVSVIPKATPNPLPTGTSTAMPVLETCFFDDFSDPTSGWITGNYPEAEFSYSPSSVPNEYNIYSLQDTNVRSASPFGPFSKYTVKVDARWADLPLGDEYGIVFGIQNKDSLRVIGAASFYRFVVNTARNREFLLRGYNIPDGWYTIVGWTVNNDAINGGTDLNTLEVRCSGSGASIYANGNLLWSGDLLCSGEVGVTSNPNSSSINTNARFDNFEICGEPITQR